MNDITYGDVMRAYARKPVSRPMIMVHPLDLPSSHLFFGNRDAKNYARAVASWFRLLRPAMFGPWYCPAFGWRKWAGACPVKSELKVIGLFLLFAVWIWSFQWHR